MYYLNYNVHHYNNYILHSVFIVAKQLNSNSKYYY